MVAESLAEANLPPSSSLITFSILAAVVKSALFKLKRREFFFSNSVMISFSTIPPLGIIPVVENLAPFLDPPKESDRRPQHKYFHLHL